MATKTRIEALDIARGLAVFGMIFMNFKISLAGDYFEGYSFLTAQEGRFGALFIFLAGTGVSLMNRSAWTDPERLSRNRKRLAGRALFLLVLGLIFSLYWQADILHFYAFYLLLSLPLLRAPTRLLYGLAALLPFLFLLLFSVLNWEQGWNWDTLEYTRFYSLRGFSRNLLFNGFHPVIPWMSFFLIGMGVGRGPLAETKGLSRKIAAAAAVVIAVELLSWFLMGRLGPGEAVYLVASRAMPPTPFFIISASAQNIFILNLVILLSRRCKAFSRLAETGRMVMTHYILHLLIGLPLLFVLNEMVDGGLGFVFLYSVVYFILTVGATRLWHRRWRQGPFEGLMRRLTG